MGFKIEYSINFLATLIDCKNIAEGGVDLWDIHFDQKKGLANNSYRTGINYKLQAKVLWIGCLTEIIKNQSKRQCRCMRTSSNIRYPEDMVRELHRVYSVQKKLMDEIRNEITQQTKNDIHVIHPNSIEQQHQTAEIPYRHDFHNVQSLREDHGSREIGFDLERPAEEDIFTVTRGFNEGEAGPSSAFQSCKISVGVCDQEMNVDLTLSIGSSQVKNSHGSLKTDRVGECSDSTNPMSSSNVTFSQQKNGSHWLTFSSSNKP